MLKNGMAGSYLTYYELNLYRGCKARPVLLKTPSEFRLALITNDIPFLMDDSRDSVECMTYDSYDAYRGSMAYFALTLSLNQREDKVYLCGNQIGYLVQDDRITNIPVAFEISQDDVECKSVCIVNPTKLVKENSPVYPGKTYLKVTQQVINQLFGDKLYVRLDLDNSCLNWNIVEDLKDRVADRCIDVKLFRPIR